MNKGKNRPQTDEEMRATMLETKERELSRKKGGGNVYKQEAGAYVDAKTQELMSIQRQAFETSISNQRVSLNDTEALKARMCAYLQACEDTATFPSSLGLARSIGYTARALRMWITNKPDSETARLLGLFNDLCADVISQSALRNNANAVFSIFISKALYGLRDSTEIVVTPQNNFAGENEYSADEIRRRYIVDSPTESDES